MDLIDNFWGRSSTKIINPVNYAILILLECWSLTKIRACLLRGRSWEPSEQDALQWLLGLVRTRPSMSPAMNLSVWPWFHSLAGSIVWRWPGAELGHFLWAKGQAPWRRSARVRKQKTDTVKRGQGRQVAGSSRVQTQEQVKDWERLECNKATASLNRE